MSLKKWIRQALVLCVLEVGALNGVPIPPEKIRELLEVMNSIKVVRVVKIDTDGR
jgi:hypothetical protein